MIDVVGESMGSHLTGVASLLQSRQVTGDATGVRGACYWTWYRHETWAALQTGRRMSLDETYWNPPPVARFDHLGPEDIANRIIFIFGRCISFYNNQADVCSIRGSENDKHGDEAISLERELDAWKAKLPLSMTYFVEDRLEGDDADTTGHQATWFIYPQSGMGFSVSGTHLTGRD